MLVLLILAVPFTASGCGEIALFFGAGIPEGVTVDGVSVAGLKAKEADEVLPEIQQAIKDRISFVFVYNGQKIPLGKQYFNISLNPGKIFQEAIMAGKKNVNYSVDYTIDVSPAREAITKLAAKYNVQPADAQFIVKPDNPIDQKFEYTASKDGIIILENALFTKLEQNAANKDFSKIIVPFITTKAGVSLEDVKKNTTLIGSFQTLFKKPKLGYSNRVFNIAKAAALMNGKVLQPGEEFDMNAILGPRTFHRGWREAGAIWDGMMVHEPGGGVCQVSTTTWNAALYAGLEITERRNHSIPSAYVPLGRDATVSTGAQNLKFVNNKQYPIYIFATANKTEKWLQVDIYGPSFPEGYEVKISQRQTDSWAPVGEDEYIVDLTLAPGEQVEDRDRRNGKSAVTYVDHYLNGQRVQRIVLTSIYKASVAIIRYNPGPSPTPAP
ncbi:MAG: VanW family protein [Bacillota bacterium]|nr:VanW family protein [Bacillota bacterium]